MGLGKNHIVVVTLAVLGISLPIFLVTGYTALYWAWLRSDLNRALPYLPWARNFGALAMAGAAVAIGILFSSYTFRLTPKTRLSLSALATATIGFYAEFRNEGKFHLKTRVHFFGPGTWIHDGLNHVASSLGDFVYRMEYSHWNDFLMGPAIVSVLFVLAFGKIYSASRNHGMTNLHGSRLEDSTELEHAQRFARILMNVGLFWFFIQAWAEKAGYWRNPHSSDEIDLPFEFAGTMLGFWMARVLTRPFDDQREKFRSTFLIDFVSSGVIGLLYTLIVGPLTERVAGTVAHSLYPVVPTSLDIHEYTALHQHLRPFELLFLAGAMRWVLNRSSRHQGLTQLSGDYEPPKPLDTQWNVLTLMAKALAVMLGYLLILQAMVSLMEPQGVGWTLATISAALGAGTAAWLLIKRATRRGFTTVLDSGPENKPPKLTKQ